MSGIAKIRVKLGSIEIEYEGPNDFVAKNLPDLLRTLAEIRNANPSDSDEGDANEGPVVPADGKPEPGLSVTTIARKLGVSSGRELMVAAALKLSRTKESFSRKVLLAEMKSASAYYKATYSNSMSTELQRACKAGDLNHVGGSDYSMPEQKKNELLAKVQ